MFTKRHLTWIPVLALAALTLSGCSNGSKSTDTTDTTPVAKTEAKAGDTVKINYTGTLADGTVFDTSEGTDPISFVLGAGTVIPGFDAAVTGMKLNESKTVTIPVDQAYGPYRDTLVQTVPVTEFPADANPQVGDRFQAGQADGSTIVVTVKAVDGDQITLDANSPLAGKDLTFSLTLVGIE